MARRPSDLFEVAAAALRSPIGGGIAALYAAQGLNYVLPLLILPYLLRVLGPETYGSIAFSQSLMGYAVIITDFGFNFSATRAISLARQSPEELARIFWSTAVAKLLILLCVTVGTLGLVAFVPQVRAHGAIIAACSPLVLGSVLLPQWYFQGLERMRAMAFVQAASKLVTLSAIFLFVRSPGDSITAAVILSLPTLVAALICLAIVATVAPVEFYKPKGADLRSAISASWHLFLGNAATSLYVNSNAFILGLVSGDTAVALYSLGNRIVKAAFGLMTPVIQAVYPRASLVLGRSSAEGKVFVRRLCVVLFGAASVVSVAILILAPQVVSVLGGPRYAGAIPIVRIMAVLPLALTVASVLAQIIMMNLGLARALSRIYLIAGSVSVVLFWTLTHRYGAVGGAVSLVLIEILGPVLMLRAIRASGFFR